MNEESKRRGESTALDMKMAEAVALFKAPLNGFTPDDIRNFLCQFNNSDETLAAAMAAVGKKTGWLHHELNDPDNDKAAIEKYDKEYDSWWELEKEIVAEIIRRLERQNTEKGTTYITTGKGWHYIIEPFMNQNGYRDGAGWWIEIKEEQ